MANFDDKYFLDLTGLEAYDELIKKYIKENTTNNATIASIIESLSSLSEASEANTEAIEVLNGGADVEGSVAKQVNDAIADLVDGAPEALDTLKEIANWISEDEDGAASLVSRVGENEKAIQELKSSDIATKEYIDNQDMAVYNSIKGISTLQIAGLFPVMQAEDETPVLAIAAVPEGGAVKLIENQTVASDIAITKSCYIDANGSTFEGTVTVPADVEVVIENAVFAKPVVVA